MTNDERQLFFAKILAQTNHAGQVDKSSQLLFSGHLRRVADRINNQFGDEHGPYAEMIAWLHDIVEDTPVTLDMIGDLFGADARADIDAVSRRETETYNEYLDRVIRRGGLALLVKLADIDDHLYDTRFITPSLVLRYNKAKEKLRGGL